MKKIDLNKADRVFLLLDGNTVEAEDGKGMIRLFNMPHDSDSLREICDENTTFYKVGMAGYEECTLEIDVDKWWERWG